MVTCHLYLTSRPFPAGYVSYILQEACYYRVYNRMNINATLDYVDLHM